MKRYISYIGQSYIPRNSLEKAVSAYLHSMDRKIVPAEDLEQFKQEIIDGINELNTEYPRCKPIDVRFSPIGALKKDVDQYILSGEVRCNFYLIEGTDYES